MHTWGWGFAKSGGNSADNLVKVALGLPQGLVGA